MSKLNEHLIRMGEHINNLDQHMNNLDEHMIRYDAHMTQYSDHMNRYDRKLDEHMTRLNDLIWKSYIQKPEKINDNQNPKINKESSNVSSNLFFKDYLFSKLFRRIIK